MRRAMSDLVVLDFDGVATADEVLTKLSGLQKEHLIDLEYVCVVVRTEAGKIQVRQAVNLTGLGAARGASIGMMVGWLAGILTLNRAWLLVALRVPASAPYPARWPTMASTMSSSRTWGRRSQWVHRPSSCSSSTRRR